METETDNPTPHSPVGESQGQRSFETPQSASEFPVPEQREDSIRRSGSAGSSGSGGRRDSSPRSTSIWGPTLDLLYTASTGGAAMFGFIMDDDPISAGFKTHQRRLNEAAAAAAAALSGVGDGDSSSSSSDEDDEATNEHRGDGLGADTSLHGATMHGFNDSSHGKSLSLMSSTHSLSRSLLDSSHGKSLLDSSHGKSLLDSSHGGRNAVDSDHSGTGGAPVGVGRTGVKRFLSNSLSFDSEHSDMDSLRGMEIIKSFPSRSNALEGISELAPVSSSTSGTASSASVPPGTHSANAAAGAASVSSAAAGLSSSSRVSGSADDSSRRHSRHHNELHRRKRTEGRDDAYPMAEGGPLPGPPEDKNTASLGVSSVSSESASCPAAPPSSSPPPARRPSLGGGAVAAAGSDSSASKLVARPVAPLRPEVLASAGMRPISPPRVGAVPQAQPQPTQQHAGPDAAVSSSLSTNFVSDGSAGPSLQGAASLELQNYSLGDPSMEAMARGAEGRAAAASTPQGTQRGGVGSNNNIQGSYSYSNNNNQSYWLSRTNSLNMSRAGGGGGVGGSYDFSDVDMRALLEDGLLSPPPPPLDMKAVPAGGRTDAFPSSSSGVGAAAMSPRRYALYRSGSATSQRYPHDYQLNSSLSFGPGHQGLGSASMGSIDMSELGAGRGEPMLFRTPSNASSVEARQQMMYLSGGVGSNSNGNMMGNMSAEWADYPLAGRQNSLGSFSSDAMQVFDESLDMPTHGANSMSRSGSGDWVGGGGGPALTHPSARGSPSPDMQTQMLLRQQHQQQQQQYHHHQQQQTGPGGFGYVPSPSRMHSLAGSVRNMSIERGVSPIYHPKGLHQHSPAGDDAAGKSKKGRGKYKCGRCGAPKANHVCAYEVGAPVCSVATQGLLVGPFQFVAPSARPRPPVPVWFANPAVFDPNDRVITARRWIQQCSPTEHGEEETDGGGGGGGGEGDQVQQLFQQLQQQQEQQMQMQYGAGQQIQMQGGASPAVSLDPSAPTYHPGSGGGGGGEGEGIEGANGSSNSNSSNIDADMPGYFPSGHPGSSFMFT